MIFSPLAAEDFSREPRLAVKGKFVPLGAGLIRSSPLTALGRGWKKERPKGKRFFYLVGHHGGVMLPSGLKDERI
jgi:hypothetical protein